MKCNFSAYVFTLLLCASVMGLAACSGALRTQHTADEVYENLRSAQNERERIEIIKRVCERLEKGGSKEPLSGLAKYWMVHNQYLYTTPTLETLLSACLHENNYHSAELERWLLDDLARSESMDRRRTAWVFLSQTDWQIEELRLLEAIELEKQVVASGEYSDTTFIFHCIARIGQRLYPESHWWQPLIQPHYYDD
jgi:hypothetical protein